MPRPRWCGRKDGSPAKTQALVRDALSRLYGPGTGDGGGYLGDEDNGQMSAWYIFGALGFYPAAPGHLQYAIGSPLLRARRYTSKTEASSR